MVKLLNGVRKNMVTLKKIDNIANLWEKTKDPKYKNLWYQLVKEFANGPHNIKRWNISSNASYKTDYGWNSVNKRRKLLRLV